MRCIGNETSLTVHKYVKVPLHLSNLKFSKLSLDLLAKTGSQTFDSNSKQEFPGHIDPKA